MTQLSPRQLDAAKTFLGYLTANTLQYFHLWRLDLKTTYWHRSGQLDTCAQKVAAAKGDIYIGVGLAERMYSGNERLREDTAVGRMAFVSDLDCKQEGFASKQDALDFAHSITLRPSVLVDSGGGIQCWWVFDSPWIFEDENDKRRCAGYAQGWHEFLSRKATRAGVKLDSVFDITRIMRVPGSFNHKLESPRPVNVVEYGDKIDHEVFADFAVEVTESERIIIPLPTSVANLATTTTDRDGLDDIEEFTKGRRRETSWVPEISARDYELFQLACPKWDSTFKMTRRDPRMRDKSKSEFAFSLAGQAAWAQAFPYSKILIALVNFYRRHGMGDKENRLDWFITTVRKAAITNPGDEAMILNVAKEAQVEEELDAVAPSAEPLVDTNSPKIAALAKMLGVPITRYLKWGIEPVTFGVEIGRRQVELGPPKEVLSQAHWRQVLYGAGYLMKALPKVHWEKVLAVLNGVWELQAMGAVSDKQLNLKHMVADLVLTQGLSIEDKKDQIRATKRGLPYTLRGEWFVPVRIVRRLIEERDGRVPTNTTMAIEMGKLGYLYERRNAASGGATKAGYYRGRPLPSPENDPRAWATPYVGDDGDEE